MEGKLVINGVPYAPTTFRDIHVVDDKSSRVRLPEGNDVLLPISAIDLVELLQAAQNGQDFQLTGYPIKGTNVA